MQPITKSFKTHFILFLFKKIKKKLIHAELKKKNIIKPDKKKKTIQTKTRNYKT